MEKDDIILFPSPFKDLPGDKRQPGTNNIEFKTRLSLKK